MTFTLQAPARTAGRWAALTLLALNFSAFSQHRHLETIEVVGTTPLGGVGQAREEIASNVQTLSALDIQNSPAQSLADLMNQNLGSVHINDNQGNPFSADVSYRGFTASSLLGTPQGLSVYMDGVRMNQPFGDTVNWELIPRSAIQGLTLIPGSNPLFGLNTLGGAISIQTKDGLSSPGTHTETSVGANNRITAEFQTGGSDGQGLHWYVLGSRFADGGWREYSSSDVTQLFTKVGFKQRDTDLKLTVAMTDARLLGGGLQQSELLRADYKSIYTKYDVVKTSTQFLNLEAKQVLSDNAMMSGHVYWRKTLSDSSNADMNEGSFNRAIYAPGDPIAPLMVNDRYTTNGFFPSQACQANAISNQAPNETCNALYNTTNTSQTNFGFSGQFNRLTESADGLNNLTVGLAYDKSIARFSQKSQFAYLNPDRTVTPVGAYADGTQDSDNAFDQRVDLSSGSNTWSLFGTNTLSTQNSLHLTVAARFNKTTLDNLDNSQLSLHGQTQDAIQGVQVARKSLTESHGYQRLNPSLSVSWVPSSAFNPYAGYSESSRAPTSIELGCADKDFSCRLPNSMAGDPYLAQVVARTWEFGARGKTPQGLQWQVGAFRTLNTDDILFVANTSNSSGGYFKNFGQTQRQGLELGLSQSMGAWSYVANFTLLDATYQSSETVASRFNSTADANGNITINPGDRIPLIPQQILKVKINYQFTPEFRSGLQLMAVGESYARGNENNLHQEGVANAGQTGVNPDPGIKTAGSGKVPGHAVINWTANYTASKQLSYFSSITNLLDQAYYTSGQLGPAAFRPDGGYNNGGCNGTTWSSNHDGACAGSMFFSPGAPRTFWVGLRYLM